MDVPRSPASPATWSRPPRGSNRDEFVFVPSPFLGSFSIKAVAPALAPGFGYDDLLEVADGSDASTVFYQLVW